MRKTWLLVPLSALLLFTPGSAQNPPQPITPVKGVGPADTIGKPRDGSKLPAAAQPIYYSAHRGMDWLKLANKPDGRFVYGFLPCLRAPMDGDNFLSQAGAAFALARATRYFRDERGAAIARQAILTLLLETAVDAKDPTIRYTAPPPQAVNRLASHGFLILAVHELAAPGKDLLDQADQLCSYLRKLQREDGALMSHEGEDPKKAVMTEMDAQCAGIALHALVRSHKHRPAEWKLDMVRKARVYYHACWQANKNIATVVTHAPAYAEAYVVTKEQAFAEAVFALNDWLIGLQYREESELTRKHWVGGFPRSADGRAESAVPDIWSALPGESLAEACRVAKHAGDLPRGQRYERALTLNLHFLMSLQYAPVRVQHFVEPFRPAILGGFHGSHQDGNLRIDFTQHPLCAMVQYLEGVIE